MKLLRTLFVPFALVCGASADAQTVAVPAFQSVEARNGAHVTVHYAAAPSVQIVSGSPKVFVAGGRLVIDNRGRPHDPRARVDVTTPNLDGLALAQGGRLTVEGGFPRIGSIAVSVANGGGLDARQLDADEVAASVSQGGLIAVRPARRLVASVNNGGIVTYWGNPSVSQSIEHGGVVERGRPEEVEGPIWTDPNPGGDR